jgi:ribose 5-phosphate isomerase B
MKNLSEQRIAICCDHAGYDLKQELIKVFGAKGVEFKDYGTNSTDSCDYADFAHPMADAIESGEFEYGISLCGTGNGINMTDNKHQGVREALCWSPVIAEFARLHNDANVLSMPARYVSEEEAYQIVEVFFSTDFEGGRHEARVGKIPTCKC